MYPHNTVKVGSKAVMIIHSTQLGTYIFRNINQIFFLFLKKLLKINQTTRHSFIVQLIIIINNKKENIFFIFKM